MNKFFSIFVIGALAFGSSGCEEENPDDAPKTNLVKVIESGLRYTLSYDEEGKLINVADQYGTVNTTLTWENDQVVVEEVGLAAQVYPRNSAGYVTEFNGMPITYNAQGQMTSWNGITFDYTDVNLLKETENNIEKEYSYNTQDDNRDVGCEFYPIFAWYHFNIPPSMYLVSSVLTINYNNGDFHTTSYDYDFDEHGRVIQATHDSPNSYSIQYYTYFD